MAYGKCLIEFKKTLLKVIFQYHVGKGAPRQARVIKNFKQDQVLNKKMFSKALEFVA